MFAFGLRGSVVQLCRHAHERSALREGTQQVSVAFQKAKPDHRMDQAD